MGHPRSGPFGSGTRLTRYPFIKDSYVEYANKTYGISEYNINRVSRMSLEIIELFTLKKHTVINTNIEYSKEPCPPVKFNSFKIVFTIFNIIGIPILTASWIMF